MRKDNVIQVRVSTELKEKLKGHDISELVRTYLEDLVDGGVQPPKPSPKIVIGRDNNQILTERLLATRQGETRPMNEAMRKFLGKNGEK